MPIGPDSPNPMILELILMLGLATIAAQILMGISLSVWDWIILCFGGIWFSLRLYWFIKSRDTHETRSQEES